jgi:hypothetical protein
MRPVAALPVELEHGVEVAGMPVLPPVELQQVDARDAEAVEPMPDARAHDRPASSARRRDTTW